MTRRARRGLADLKGDMHQRVREAIVGLATNPRPTGCMKLTGREGWRIRVGDYRILYTINDDARLVTVVDVGHRREIYRA
jgi:mRNA interferase RelE/StbE